MSEVTVTRMAPGGMITLRGDPAEVGAAAAGVTRAEVPGPLTITGDGVRGLGWMAPDELLILLPADEVAEALERLGADLDGVHHLAVDVSDARSRFALEGRGVRDIVQKLTPADLSEAAFPVGCLRRTRLAQVAGAIWMAEESRIEAICFRSVTDYVETLLRTAAEAGPPGFHAPL
ncbi:sarcosine oxidase subunit gamma [Histidinibacterium lentulum]|uniref:Sarcosine oxidase subunit gamma n=1 Tax=Histidinibacterium lentulum TaxID=2480588 RepID=A0A3N2QY78_9RHOB|nr:sarcosine oxidase subunit gamma family protein [Histidinibacterium lentulum]ROU00103.1 sarcosine oxidase subunit gamma [Histidinibacterium lentulum]